MVPPIRLWDAGVPNRAALSIMTRNSRMPESLAADLDAECSACLMGARRLGELFERYGVRRGRGLLRRDPRPHHRDVPPRDPGQDPGRVVGLGGLRRARRRRRAAAAHPADHADPHRPDDPDGERLVLDFDGTGPQAKGPINHCGDYSDGVFLKKWLAPILRNLADTPERMAELDVNEGVVPLIEMRFPEPGTLLTPVFPAPTNARTFVILRLLGVLAGRARQGGRRPDAGRPGDHPLHRRVRRRRRRPPVPDARGARRRLRRPLLRRRRGHHPRRPRLAEPADGVHRGALPVPGRGARAGRRTAAARAGSAAGSATRSTSGCCSDAHFMSIADRSILSCWGVNGREGRPPVPGDDRPRRPGRARGRCAGGRRAGARRRGDPHPDHRRWRLGRPARARPGPGRPRRGLAEGLARGRAGRLRRGAHRSPERTTSAYDAAATAAERAGRSRSTEAFFDRGPGYARLAGGASYADVDVLD